MAPYENTLREVRAALEAARAGVDPYFDAPPEALGYRPADGGWTTAQVLEHITLTSHFLMIVIRKSTAKAIQRAARSGAPESGESDLALLADIGRHGAFRWIRPEHMEPGEEPDLPAVRERFHQQLDECRGFLDAMPNGEGALIQVRMSVNNSGKLDVYQWIYFLAQHALRHVTQMEGNREEGGAESRR